MFFDRIKAPVTRKSKEKNTAPRIVFSDDFEKKSLPEPEESSHSVVTILRQEDSMNSWTCPECECENTLSAWECCVCHYIKRGATDVLL